MILPSQAGLAAAKALHAGGENLEQINPTEHPAVVLAERAVYTVLSAAARGDVEEICRVHHEHGITMLTAADANGRTPLHCAACEGHARAARYILGELQAADASGSETAAALARHDRWGLTPVDIVSVDGARGGGRHPSRKLAALFAAVGGN